MFSSIRLKIILFYLAVLLILLSALGLFLSVSLHKVVHNAIDSELRSRAEELALLISNAGDETKTNFSREAMEEYNLPKSKSYFQICRLDGTILGKSASLKTLQLPLPGKTSQSGFQTFLLNGSPTRLINFHLSREPKIIYKGEPLDQLVIQCAKDINDRIELLEKFNFILILSIFSILVISAFGGFFIAHKALTPVKDISKTIDRISESNLSERITLENIPTELKTLAFSFNQTFDRLEQSFKRQRQFAADASHELRTPVTVILSQGEVTLRKEREPREYKEALSIMVQSARMMSEIIRKLLTITRLGTDKKILKAESLKLDEIVRESVKLLSPMAEQKGLLIRNDFKQSVEIFGDRALLVELFTNLIENAIKYNRLQGQITISAKKDPPWIVCQIEDTGIGIPGENLERVFDRFYRVDKSRSKEIGGSGLGLSICKEIVQLHGGKINLTSINGSGTIVSVLFRETMDHLGLQRA